MKRFYCTTSPNQCVGSDFLKATLADAVRVARQRVESNGTTVYVVQIVRKVESAPPPVKVTVVK